MPGLDGLEVLARLEHKPVVILTTAYDSYAVTAFELRALDYLLKPFGRVRFMAALERARETLTGTGRASASTRAHDAIDPEQPLRTVFVRAPHRLVRVAVEDISHFEARDDYVAMYTPSGRLLASLRMNDLERMLDPGKFLRVHRSRIVNLDAVVSITPDRTGRFVIAMRDGSRFMCSRRRARDLRRRAV
jgi:two-component system LytT family response regulator